MIREGRLVLHLLVAQLLQIPHEEQVGEGGVENFVNANFKLFLIRPLRRLWDEDLEREEEPMKVAKRFIYSRKLQPKWGTNHIPFIFFW